MPEEKALMERPTPAQRPDDKVTVCGCFPCHPETRDTLNEMLDVSLLKDSIFILFTISNFLTSIGFYIPYTFLVVSIDVCHLSFRSVRHDVKSLCMYQSMIGRIIHNIISS